MPKTKKILDDILRDEAKLMLGRTPAQGWLKPERVTLSPSKPTTARHLFNRYSLELGELEFVVDSPRTRLGRFRWVPAFGPLP